MSTPVRRLTTAFGLALMVLTPSVEAQQETVQSTSAADIVRQCSTTLRHIMANQSIRFDAGKHTLNGANAALIDTIANLLAFCPRTSLVIEGHTDNRGSAQLNQSLSEARASAVADALVERGIARSRLVVRGLGGERPIADNGTRDGRRTNRRIELRLNAMRQDDVL